MAKVKFVEVQMDGLVGPTHNYSGLAEGNLYSMENRGEVSNPRAAFLQALDKAKLVADLGVPQLVFPPHKRPLLKALRSRGIFGSPPHMLWHTYLFRSKELFYSVWSSSGMWMANAATVTPEYDSEDHKLHITPASLTTLFHRSLETKFVYELFLKIFGTVAEIHPPLAGVQYGDEGAANHMRFARQYTEDDERGENLRGLNLFVYGRSLNTPPRDLRFPARQTYEACKKIIETHKIRKDQFVLKQLTDKAIQSGVFHNDVISTNCYNLWLFHESAYFAPDFFAEYVGNCFGKLGGALHTIIAREKDLPLKDAVSSYIFNSQFVLTPYNGMVALAPTETEETPRAKRFLEEVAAGYRWLKKIYYVNIRQSMKNGGGPACLRLRIPMKESDISKLYGNVRLTHELYLKLKDFAQKHYRDRLALDDLRRDESLINESYHALDGISKILGLGNIYEFQL